MVMITDLAMSSYPFGGIQMQFLTKPCILSLFQHWNLLKEHYYYRVYCQWWPMVMITAQYPVTLLGHTTAISHKSLTFYQYLNAGIYWKSITITGYMPVMTNGHDNCPMSSYPFWAYNCNFSQKPCISSLFQCWNLLKRALLLQGLVSHTAELVAIKCFKKRHVQHCCSLIWCWWNDEVLTMQDTSAVHTMDKSSTFTANNHHFWCVFK